MTAPLHGVKVLDFTELLPGPFLTQSLVELGAEVTKVERPPKGDPVRSSNPGVFGAVNRGKRSVALNLKDEGDRARALALAAEADVVCEGFRPGVMERLGLGYAAVAAANPGAVYLSLSGYGQTGPMRDVPGHDLNYLALAGITALCGRPGEAPEHGIGVPLADLAGALYGLSSVLAALVQRGATGRGQHLDLSLTDCAAHLLNPRRGAFTRLPAGDLAAQRRMALVRPAYGVFRCRDGALTIAANEGHFWTALVRHLGLEAFAAEDYRAIARRNAEAEAINAAIAAAVAPMARDEAVAAMLAADIPAAPVLTPQEAAVSPHAQARGLSAPTAGAALAPFPVRLEGMEDAPFAPPELDADV